MCNTIEDGIRRQREKYERALKLLRKANSWNCDMPAYGHEDEYVGRRTWLFISGYVAQLIHLQDGREGIIVGWWDSFANLWFSNDSEAKYLTVVEDEESIRNVLDKLSRWQWF